MKTIKLIMIMTSVVFFTGITAQMDSLKNYHLDSTRIMCDESYNKSICSESSPIQKYIWKLHDFQSHKNLYTNLMRQEKTQEINDMGDRLQTYLQFSKKSVDEFDGTITYRTLPAEIYFEKIIKQSDTSYYISLNICTQVVTLNPGVIILFTDGTKIEKPDAKITQNSTGNGYETSTFIKLSNNDILLLRTKIIKAYRLYVNDEYVDYGNLFRILFNNL